MGTRGGGREGGREGGGEGGTFSWSFFRTAVSLAGTSCPA